MHAAEPVDEVSISDKAVGDRVAKGKVLGVDQKTVDGKVGIGWIDLSQRLDLRGASLLHATVMIGQPLGGRRAWVEGVVVFGAGDTTLNERDGSR